MPCVLSAQDRSLQIAGASLRRRHLHVRDLSGDQDQRCADVAFAIGGGIAQARRLYCIDIDRHDGVDLVRRRRLWRERKVKIGTLRVDVREFHRPIEWHDAMHSIYELECTIHFPKRRVVTRDLIPVRYTTPPLMDLIARASGCFGLIASYPDLSFTRPIEECGGRWLAVLKRL